MIRPYLSDMINDHKTQEVWKIHSGNKVTDYKTQGKWKIQLLITIYFVSSTDLMKFVLCIQKMIIYIL